ncbi:MAG: RQC domain-containing protein [Syntrophales bacterium]
MGKTRAIVKRQRTLALQFPVEKWHTPEELVVSSGILAKEYAILSSATIVVSPLISLMKDQMDQLRETGVPDRCGMCDNCRTGEEEKALVDLTIPAQMFLSCVKRTGEIFGAGHIVDVLRGSNSQKILKFRHERLSTYGIGTAYSLKQWHHLSRQFIQKSLLLYDYEHGMTETGPNGRTRACSPSQQRQAPVSCHRRTFALIIRFYRLSSGLRTARPCRLSTWV